MTKSGLRLPGLMLVAVALLGQSAHATVYYWDTNGTAAGPGATPSGTWTASSNWNTDVTGGGAGSFGTVPTSVDDAFIAAGPTGATGAYTIALGGATVDVKSLSANSTVAVTIGSSVGDGTINVGSSGSGSLTTSGSSSLTINSNLNLVGNVTWTNSQGANPTGLTVGGAISGTGNFSFANNTGRASVFSGNVNNIGSLTVTGSNGGVVSFTGGIGSNVTNFSTSTIGASLLTGTNSYTGTTTLLGTNSGTNTLRIGSTNALPTGTTLTLTPTSAKSKVQFDLGSGTTSSNVSVAGLVSTGSATAGNIRQGAAIITNSDSTAGGSHTGTLTVTTSGSNDFSGLIRDGANSKVGVAMAGTGTLTLSGASGTALTGQTGTTLNYGTSYSGGTTVSSGTLVTKADAGSTQTLTVAAIAAGTATQSATVASTAGLAVGQAITASNFAAGTYIIGIVNGTTINLSTTATATGAVSTVFSGYQTIGTGAVTASGTGTLDLNGSTTSSVGAVIVSGGTIQNGTLTGTSYATSGGAVSASLAGTAALTQSSGTTTLSGANTYSGGTTISGGTLLIAASNSLQGATGATAVNSGTLSSNVAAATLGGGLTLAGGTITADGSAVGSFTLTSGNNFTMSSGTLGLTFASLASDQILGSGAGTFTLTGGTFDLTNTVTNYAATYQILSGFASGSVSGLSFTNYDTTNYVANLSNAGVLSFTAVPEPSTYALLGMGLGALFFLRRRAMKKA